MHARLIVALGGVLGAEVAIKIALLMVSVRSVMPGLETVAELGRILANFHAFTRVICHGNPLEVDTLWTFWRNAITWLLRCVTSWVGSLRASRHLEFKLLLSNVWH